MLMELAVQRRGKCVQKHAFNTCFPSLLTGPHTSDAKYQVVTSIPGTAIETILIGNQQYRPLVNFLL